LRRPVRFSRPGVRKRWVIARQVAASVVMVAIVVVALPISNFILFRLWVYKPGDDTRTRAMRGGDTGAEETGVRRAGGQ